MAIGYDYGCGYWMWLWGVTMGFRYGVCLSFVVMGCGQVVMYTYKECETKLSSKGTYAVYLACVCVGACVCVWARVCV